MNPVLPDAAAAHRARAHYLEVYQAKGHGPGMAAFLAMYAWEGEFTDAYFAQPDPNPAEFGLPDEDDGSRDHPLLSGRAMAITDYHPDVAALSKAPTRVVIAVGGETGDVYTARTARSTARLLGHDAAVFPSHHAGFLGGESGWPGQPEAFAARLRELLNHHALLAGRHTNHRAPVEPQPVEPPPSTRTARLVADYRATRPKVERKLGHLTRRRHGGRRARIRGTARVDADIRLLAAR